MKQFVLLLVVKVWGNIYRHIKNLIMKIKFDLLY